MVKKGFIRIPWKKLLEALYIKDGLEISTIDVDVHSESIDIILSGDGMPEFSGALCSVPLQATIKW